MEKTQPTIVCLCGSTRFYQAFREANVKETLAGKIVLSIGCDTKSDKELLQMTPDEQTACKTMLDQLHLHKIDLAEEVLILNVGGYIGTSTENELTYAMRQGKHLRFLEGTCHECGQPSEALQMCFLCGVFCCPCHHYTTPASTFGNRFHGQQRDIIECLSCGCK